jgi:hypothetical protein
MSKRDAGYPSRSKTSVPYYAGGNFDDAYDGGVKDGETWLARRVLKETFPNNKEYALY